MTTVWVETITDDDASHHEAAKMLQIKAASVLAITAVWVKAATADGPTITAALGC
jgi:hypothetical protein